MITFTLAQQTAESVQLSYHSTAIGQTIKQALLQLGKSADTDNIGVWNKKIKPKQLLNHGDRVELYLPLIADPKDARRARVNRTLAQQAAKENAANRVVNRQSRARREATKLLENSKT